MLPFLQHNVLVFCFVFFKYKFLDESKPIFIVDSRRVHFYSRSTMLLAARHCAQVFRSNSLVKAAAATAEPWDADVGTPMPDLPTEYV